MKLVIGQGERIKLLNNAMMNVDSQDTNNLNHDTNTLTMVGIDNCIGIDLINTILGVIPKVGQT